MSLAKEIISSDEISLISEAQLASFTTPSKSPKRYGKKISKPSVYFLINISLYKFSLYRVCAIPSIIATSVLGLKGNHFPLTSSNKSLFNGLKFTNLMPALAELISFSF